MNQQVIGQVTAIEPRNAGWVAVHVHEPGKQYPKKLSTKKTELIQAAQQLVGQIVTAGYNEATSDSINPHTGQPYINRYLEAITLGQVDLVGPTQIQPQQLMPQQPQPQPMQTAVPQQVQPMPQQMQAQQPVAMPQATLTHVVRDDDVRTKQIHRQTAAKVSVQLLEHLDPEERNLASLLRISEQLVKYFEEGVPWTVPQTIQHQGPAPAEYAHGDDPGPQEGQHDYGDVPY